MTEVAAALVDETSALHILPLRILPLQTPALRRARLVKNVRLDGVVELFAHAGGGRGHVPPSALFEVFNIPAVDHHDVDMVQMLSRLPSYDVYSLRLMLRSLGISVDESADLRLPAERVAELAAYMQEFTRPLVQAVYGEAAQTERSFADILKLFTRPDMDQARRNLMRMARQLDIELMSIPAFLEDYGDVYLSLAYYQYCHDTIQPLLAHHLDALREIRESRQFASQAAVQRSCHEIERQLQAASADISMIMDVFHARTQDMWQDISAEAFRDVRDLIISYHNRIGAALCAMTVKLWAWQGLFKNGHGNGHADGFGPGPGLSRRVEFIMSEMRVGLDRIPAIEFYDTERA